MQLVPDLDVYILSPPTDFTPHYLFPSCCMDVSYGLYLKLSRLCWNTSTIWRRLRASSPDECVSHEIHQTIQGLPVRCPSVALGSRDICLFISQQQLNFINSITSMSTTDLPRLILKNGWPTYRSLGSSHYGNSSASHPLNSWSRPREAKHLGNTAKGC